MNEELRMVEKVMREEILWSGRISKNLLSPVEIKIYS